MSKPRPERPTLDQVLPLVRAVYARHAAGCCLHLVTDDGNVDQRSADFCRDQAWARMHADCIAAATLLSLMTGTGRRQIYRRH